MIGIILKFILTSFDNLKNPEYFFNDLKNEYYFIIVVYHFITLILDF